MTSKAERMWGGSILSAVLVLLAGPVRAGYGDGLCAYFADSSNCVNYAPYSASLDFGLGAFTIEGWVKCDNLSTSDGPWLAGLGRVNRGYFGYGLWLTTSGALGLELANGASTKIYSTTAIVPNQWNHVAVVRSADALTVRFYVNGVCEEGDVSSVSAINITPASTSVAFHLGYPVYDAQGESHYFAGYLDELRFWKGVERTAEQIRSNMYVTLSPASAGLSAYYQFESQDFSDSTANDNDAPPTYNTGPPPYLRTYHLSRAFAGPVTALALASASNNCLVMAGADTGSRFAFDSGAFTVESWVKTSAAAAQTLFAYGSELVVFLSADGVVNATVGGASTKFSRAVNDGRWRHVAVARDAGGNLSCYVDGELDATVGGCTGAVSPSGAPACVGRDNTPANCFDGQLDELRVWASRRTQDEIRGAMMHNLAGDEADLRLYLNMNGQNTTGMGDYLYDASSYGGAHLGVALTNFTAEQRTTCFPASGAFNTWLPATAYDETGGTSADWATAANWTRGTVPAGSSPYDNVGIYPYSGFQNPIIPDTSATVAVQELLVAPSAQLTYNEASGNRLEVSGHLLVQGVLNLGTSENALHFTGAGQQILDGSLSVHDLVVDQSPAATVKLKGNQTVSGDLTTSAGSLDLNGCTVTLGATSTLHEDASDRVIGSSGWIQTTRSLTTTTPGNVANLGAEIVSLDKPLDDDTSTTSTIIRLYGPQTGVWGRTGVSVSYEFVPGKNNTGLNATLKYNYWLNDLAQPDYLNGIPRSRLVMFRSTDGGLTWGQDLIPSSRDDSNNPGYVQTTGISGFSRFTLGDRLEPLLVTLLWFRGEFQEDGRVRLEWQTATEIDNAGFHVWRAEDPAGDWTRLNAVIIPGQGNEVSGARYCWDDDAVLPGKRYYYKLEDVDFTGKSIFHDFIVIDTPGCLVPVKEFENDRRPDLRRLM